MQLTGRRVANGSLRSLRTLHRIRTLTLFDTSIDDQGIVLLSKCQVLEELHIVSSLITDRSMPLICQLPCLKSLFLDRVPHVSDAGIVHLKEAMNLVELVLRGTQLSDEGLRSLLHLPRLMVLGIDETAVTDKGISQLDVLPVLDVLSAARTHVSGIRGAKFAALSHVLLGDCPVTDDGVDGILSAAANLRTLVLSGSAITDTALEQLARCRSLEELYVDNTLVSDAGIAALEGHPNLLVLSLTGTACTQQCADRLKRANRRLRIEWDVTRAPRVEW